MRRTFSLSLAAVLAMAMLVALAGVALAANPHFLKASATGPAANGNLAVNFKIVGLGANQSLTVTARANATALYACQNNGGNFPNDPKKQQESGIRTASGTFTSDKNGNIVGSLTLTPPPSTLSCPGGQHSVLVSVSYTNVSVSAPGAGTRSIPGTFSRTFFNI